MRRSIAFVVGAALVASALPAGSRAASGTFSTAASRALVALSEPAVSPDGKRAIVLAAHVNWKADRIDRDLDLFDLATHARRTLTYERKGLDDPQWSPDGTRIGFIADEGTGDDAKPQVYVMSLEGGDPRPVTADPGGVTQFAWRPDGDAIAYAAAAPKPKRTGADAHRDAFVFTTEPITTREPDPPVHLFLVPAAGGTARQLTRGARSVATGEAQTTLSWSPDGKTLAYLSAPDAVLNDAYRAHVDLLDVASGRQDELTTNAGFESAPLFAPDGGRVAYQHSAGDGQSVLTNVYVAAPGQGNGANVTAAYDRSVHDDFWAADSRALYFTCANRTRLELVRAPVGGAPAAVDTGDVNVTSVGDGQAANGAIVFVGTKADSPAELYVLPRGTAAPERVSDYNAATRALDLAKATTVTFPTSTGVTGDAVLWHPPGYAAGRKYPLVLLVHGGPTASSAESFDAFPQALAARGWLVLQPNYRGSDDLGLAYQRGVLYDPDDGPGRDIMAAIAAVEATGIVDARRIAVSGWSYGGIMTAWMISKYHVFRAAVSGASVDDWATDYGVADDLQSDVALFHGSPYVRNGYQDEWKRASAITYAPDVTTPVLIISDAGDNRDPFATSSMYYRALHDNHKDATLVQYPVDGHFPRDPVRRADVIDRFGDYIAAHFR